ncbi:hypothetical protein [Pseudomonas silesiensis]|jgi:hypothetical protein|uniref:hypothetical protein n=1 Tax=Pseudomonas silesiensis TaxID=1853130 RepID=UPI0012600CE3|nr:hypothetical protein [Pseudomonas silesiensis]
MFVLLDKGEVLIDVFLRPMLLPQERLAQKVESHGFLERQASKDFVALMVFTEGAYFPEVRALHVREHKHLDLLSIATAKLCRNAQRWSPNFLGLLVWGQQRLKVPSRISSVKKRLSERICQDQWLVSVCLCRAFTHNPRQLLETLQNVGGGADP